MGISFAPFCLVRLFNVSHASEYVMPSDSGLHLHFLHDNGIENLSMYYLSFVYFFWWSFCSTMLFIFYCVVLLLKCKHFLYILVANLLVYVLQTFSSVCLFLFLTMSLNKWKCFILMKPYLLIFFFYSKCFGIVFRKLLPNPHP